VKQLHVGDVVFILRGRPINEIRLTCLGNGFPSFVHTMEVTSQISRLVTFIL